MAGRAIEKLRKAANLKSTRRLVVLDNGDEFEFWSTPLTMAQREKANRDAKSDDINQFALQLLLTKADESGSRLFSPGDLAVLKNETRDSDLQKLMLAVIQEPEEGEEGEIDLKSNGSGAGKG